jgi:hypothetical protein
MKDGVLMFASLTPTSVVFSHFLIVFSCNLTHFVPPPAPCALNPRLFTPHHLLKFRKMRIYLLSFVTGLLTHFSAFAQETPCTPLAACDQVSLRIRLIENQTGAACPTSSIACAEFSPSRQVLYRVELVQNTNVADPQIADLDYKELYAEVVLNVLNPTSNSISKININATKKCNQAALIAWVDEIFEVTNYSASIRFDDYNANSCPPNAISFQAESNGPGNPASLVATLFDVVVDVYPGEQIQLNCGEFDYNSGDGTDICEGPNGNNPAFDNIMCFAAAPIAIGLPTVPESTSGPGRISIFTTQAPNPNSTNGKIINIFAKNTNLQTYTPGYMEFVLDIEFSISMQMPVFTPSATSVSFTSTQLSPTKWRYKFLIVNQLLPNSNPPFKVGQIEVAGPMLENQCWNATLTFPFPNGARMLGSNDCLYRLNVPTTPTTYENIPGNSSCAELCTTNASGVNCVVSLLPAVDCSGPSIQIELTSDDPNALPIALKGFEIGIESGMSGSLNYGNAFASTSLGCSNPAVCSILEYSSANGRHYYSFLRSSGTQNVVLTNGTAKIRFPTSGSGCVFNPEVYHIALIFGDGSKCIPEIISQGQGVTMCGLAISGLINTEDGDGVENVKVDYEQCNVSSCTTSVFTIQSGSYSDCPFCNAAGCNSYKITPSLNEDPLNGVTTYDLVLISRHILGLEPLNSPYKMIAADANKSNTISSFDIIELRKLILGIYNELPNNDSWRFVDASQIFSQPYNPFSTTIIENVTVMPNQSANFIGIKIGDLNLSAQANGRPAERPVTQFAWSAPAARAAGSFVTVPVRYTGSDTLLACQLGFRFDPRQLRLLEPTAGQVPGVTPQNFGLTRVQEGQVRFVWLAPLLDPEQMLATDQVLFYLTFEVLRDLSESTVFPLELDNSVLDNAVWNTTDTELSAVQQTTPIRPRQAEAQTAPTSVSVQCTPNPTRGPATLTIDPTISGKARVGLFAADGRMIRIQNIELVKGQRQQIDLPDLSEQPNGVYIWKVFNSSFKVQGHLVVQH